MTINLRLSLVLISALIFTILFKDLSTGLNVFIYCLILIGLAWFAKPRSRANLPVRISMTCLLISASAYVFNASSITLNVTLITGLTMIGSVVFESAKSSLLGFYNSIYAFMRGPILFFRALFSQSGFQMRLAPLFKKLSITLLPMVIISIFIWMYMYSNELFGRGLAHVFEKVGNAFVSAFNLFEPVTLFYTLTGTILGSAILFSSTAPSLLQSNSALETEINRVRKKRVSIFSHHTLSLLDEYRSGVFLFGVLNLLLLGLNSSDIAVIWMGFEWQGEYLKPMLHEGTYILITSILISMALVLYYFRENLNFLQKNSWLKRLCYLWIAQNAFLSLSVMVRVYHYIAHYNLAHKRIGVIVFVLLCLIGLYLIYRKIAGKKSTHFLIRHMSAATLVVITAFSIPNWDRVIAQYNFEHSGTAFVHLDFLSRLDDSALPYLQKDPTNMSLINESQKEKFSGFSGSHFKRLYMGPSAYISIIESRTEKFIMQYKTKSWLEWTYAEYSAYQKLK